MQSKRLAFWLTVALFICLGSSSLTGFAQAKQPAQEAEERRDIEIVKEFETGKVDGVKVVIYSISKEGRMTPVTATHEFHAGDEVKFSVRSNFHGYVYVVNQGASGKYRLLYPNGTDRNKIAPGEEKLLPSSYAIKFDKTRGKEIVQVFLSKQRIGFFDVIAKQDTNGLLSNTQVAHLSELWKASDATLQGVTKLETVKAGKTSAVQAVETRKPLFDINNTLAKSTLVIWPRHKKAAPKHIQVSAFSINLKNNGATR